MADINQPAFDSLQALVEAAYGNAQALSMSPEEHAALVRAHIIATEMAGRITSEILFLVCEMTGIEVKTIPLENLMPETGEDMPELMKMVIDKLSPN